MTNKKSSKPRKWLGVAIVSIVATAAVVAWFLVTSPTSKANSWEARDCNDPRIHCIEEELDGAALDELGGATSFQTFVCRLEATSCPARFEIKQGNRSKLYSDRIRFDQNFMFEDDRWVRLIQDCDAMSDTNFIPYYELTEGYGRLELSELDIFNGSWARLADWLWLDEDVLALSSDGVSLDIRVPDGWSDETLNQFAQQLDTYVQANPPCEQGI